MEKDKIYPIDIFSVCEYGFDKWQEWFFWPLHHNWWLDLQNDVKEIFVKFINQNDNEVGDIVLIKSKLYYELSNILYAVKITQELQKRGKKIIYSNKSLYFKGLVENGVPEFNFMERVKYQKPPLLKQILISIANLRDEILYRIYFLSTGNKIPLVAIGRPVYKREYFSSLSRKPIRLLNNGAVFEGRRAPISPALLKTVNETVERFIREICVVADKHSIDLIPEQIEFMKNLTFRQFKKTAEDYISVKNKLEKTKKFHMFSGAHGAYFLRLLGQAMRRAGGKVTSFTHGHDVFPCSRNSYCMEDWSTVDEYVVGVSNSADRMQKTIAENPIPRNNRVKFISENSKFFLDLYNRKKIMKLPDRIKTVVVMGFSYRTDSVRTDHIPDLVSLDYETRLIDFLVKHGYKVLYKKHPHGTLKGNVVKIFSEKATVIYERFEDVMDIGDAYLYSAVGSSTWTQAICTKKPIIYINNEWHDIWFPETYELIKKRCRVVSGGFDERNRFMFNEKELLDTLAQKVEEPNTEFIEKYMFPENVSGDRV